MQRLERLAESIVQAVKRYVSQAENQIALKVEERIATIALPPKGEKGDRGEKGEKGDPGEPGLPGAAGADGLPGERGEKGDPGEKGEAGERGERGPEGLVGPTGAPGKDGTNGWDGKDGAPGERGEKGENGRDGKDGRDGRDGEDGLPGKDAAAVVPLDGIDCTRTYPRGTWAAYRGGLFCSQRATDPFDPELDPIDAGWTCVLNGIHRVGEEVFDDGRLIRRTIVLSNGDFEATEIRTKAVIYRGVFKAGDYFAGDMVTWGGSVWHALKDTNVQPGGGCPDWQLAVKKGEPGKAARSEDPPARKPVAV